MINPLGERLIDNVDTQRREAWYDGRCVAWIDADRLKEKGFVGWTSRWMRRRWQPEKTFGRLRGYM